MDFKSMAFGENERIPERYTGEGGDISPPLKWNGEPTGTKELVLIVDDPDAPMEKPFVHWVLYKIPATLGGIPEGNNLNAAEGKNSRGKIGYMGPMPPEGHGTHRYHFKLYALDKKLDIGKGAEKEDVLDAIEGHILDEAEVVGTYER